MTFPNRRQAIAALAGLIALPRTALAQMRQYQLVQGESQVGFLFDLQGSKQRGTIPVHKADIRIDPKALHRAVVAVDLNVAKARTGIFLATQALTGPEVLNVAHYPMIRFRSTQIRLAPSGRLSDGAAVIGDLTIRDVTRQITLSADIYRPAGSAPDALDRLSIQLKGSISRQAFGAVGFPKLVADQVQIDIRAVIHVTE
ncbi:YceI family protein [Aliisedimentitalea scapharcae]|uniref:YceI family protein n=1 Tax=Aliisedimentitalea scapharcae TaxID=1524259 RepID=A0ABZ2XY83_9RHOB|nr:YceI family protein [Rhodobacteraceae bacterium M382]